MTRILAVDDDPNIRQVPTAAQDAGQRALDVGAVSFRAKRFDQVDRVGRLAERPRARRH